MAVQVTLDFTDPQWALMQEHFCLPNVLGESQHITTIEELKSKLEIFVKHRVERCLLDADVDAAVVKNKTSFDV
jgi:hypothetical protein